MRPRHPKSQLGRRGDAGVLCWGGAKGAGSGCGEKLGLLHRGREKARGPLSQELKLRPPQILHHLLRAVNSRQSREGPQGLL